MYPKTFTDDRVKAVKTLMASEAILRSRNEVVAELYTATGKFFKLPSTRFCVFDFYMLHMATIKLSLSEPLTLLMMTTITPVRAVYISGAASR